MNKIGELFEKPIDRTIEEVIKVDQTNEATVRNEIEESIAATDSIRDQFVEVYREIASGTARPREASAYGFQVSLVLVNRLLLKSLGIRSLTGRSAIRPRPSFSKRL